MKTALPENAKIAKEAKECMQECVSEFISFITSEGMLNSELEDNLQLLTACCSFREVPSRKAEDCEWRGYSVCHDVSWI
jgi:hypothetical protein